MTQPEDPQLAQGERTASTHMALHDPGAVGIRQLQLLHSRDSGIPLTTLAVVA